MKKALSWLAIAADIFTVIMFVKWVWDSITPKIPEIIAYTANVVVV